MASFIPPNNNLVVGEGDGSKQLVYREDGNIIFDGSQKSFTSAGKPLCFDCSVEPTRVYFMDAPDERLRFFHEIPFDGSLGSFDASVGHEHELPESAAECSFAHL